MALSKTTKDHDEIRKWAEAPDAVPAEVASTHITSGPGILRFEFPDAPNRKDGNLQEISWEAFFEKFDANDLELLYQEKTADGETSNFNKLVHPDKEDHSTRRRKASTASKSKKKSSAA